MWTLWEWIYRFDLAPAGVGRADRQTSPGPLRFARLQSALGLRPRRALSSAGEKVFPVSVSLGVYRVGNGKQFELIASGVPHDFSLGGQFRQGGADGGGAHAAEFAQLVQRHRFLELSQSLTHPIHRCRWRGGFDQGTLKNRQSQSRARLSQLERDMVLAGSGAMLGGEGQLGTFASHVEIGVTPAVELTGTAQGLARPAGVRVFAGMMNQQDGQLELALETAQIREQRRDLAGVIFIHPMKANERV